MTAVLETTAAPTTASVMLTKAYAEYGISELENDKFLTTVKERVAVLPPAKEKEGYELRRKVIADLRKIRTTIEGRRKELKADSLEYGRRIDAFAKHWTSQIMAIEEPLRIEKEAVDQDKEDARKAAEEAERKAQEDAARKRIAEEEARLAELRKADEERVKAEQEKREKELAVEREKLREAAERLRKIEEEQSAERKRQNDEHAASLKRISDQHEAAERKQREERERLDAERRQFEAEQAEVRRKEEERAQAERAAAEEAQAEKWRLERADRIKPDVVKMREYGRKLMNVTPPGVHSQEAKDAVNEAFNAVGRIAKQLANFA